MVSSLAGWLRSFIEDRLKLGSGTTYQPRRIPDLISPNAWTVNLYNRRQQRFWVKRLDKCNQTNLSDNFISALAREPV
jgi:hypothetical protein